MDEARHINFNSELFALGGWGFPQTEVLTSADAAPVLSGGEGDGIGGPWHLVISRAVVEEAVVWTATVSNLYTGFGTAIKEFNGGAEVSITLYGGVGDTFLGANINMETHSVELVENISFEAITEDSPSRGSMIVKLPLYKLRRASSKSGYQVARLWDLPRIAWYE